MAKIYLPTDLVDNSCKVVNNDYIRVYTNQNYTSWTDVYFKNGYYLKTGSNQYGQVNVSCDNINTYTDNIFYRYDLADSMIIFFVITIVCFYFPFKIFSRAFGRWFKI